MTNDPTFYPIPFMVAAVCIFIVSQYTLSHRDALGGRYLYIVCLAASFWSVTEGILYLDLTIGTKILVTQCQYVGIVPVAPMALLFVLSVFGFHPARIVILRRLLIAMMVVIVAVVWTNPFHRQFFTGYFPIHAGTVDMLGLHHGPFWWATIIYHYFLVLVTSLILISISFRASGFPRAQALVILTAVASVWIANAVYISGFSPIPNMDISPIAFTLVAGSMAWGFFRHNLLDIMPAAKTEIFRGLDDAILVFDQRNRVADANPAAEALFGSLLSADVDHRTEMVFDHYPVIKKIIEKRSSREVPLRVDGQKMIFDVRVTELPGSDGGSIGHLMTLRDVTERKQAVEAILESEEKYKFLAENMGDIVWVQDLNFNATYVSPSIEKVLGFTTEERKQQKLEDMVTPASLEQISAALGEQLALEEAGGADPDRSLTVEVEYYHRNGSTVWMENAIKALRDADGRLTGMYGVSRDITERKRVEQELVRAKEDWERTFNAVSDLIAILDDQYRIVRINKAMADKLGVSPGDAIGQTCHVCVHCTDQPASDCPHRLLLADGREHSAEVFEERLGGDYLVSVSPIYDDDGRLLGSVHVARDITRRKQSEQEREALIAELKEALDSVRTLKGLLPICASCKRIRDDKGYWNQLESYIHQHSDAEFSHSICPECAKKLYPGINPYDE